MKLCNVCQETKPFSNFYKRGDYEGYRSECKQCMQAKASRRWRNDPEFKKRGTDRNRRWQRQNFYGLSIEDEILLQTKQNNACAICQKKFKTDADYHVDHCHATKKIRGLLCSGCNRGLGCFQDNPIALRQAANYVECQDNKISNGVSTE